MEIKRDFTLTFDEATYTNLYGDRMVRLLERPPVRAQFEQALADVRTLTAPAACWDSFPIAQFLHEKIVLADGTRLGGGPVVEVTGGAEELIVAVCTIGPALDERIRQYGQENEMVAMIFLDEMASWGVDQVRQQLCSLFDDEMAARGWRTSAPLSPGESAWSVEDQPALFGLLDAAQIGVTLTESKIMRPLKSLSMIMGTGRQPMGVEDASNCDFCSLRDRCRYRGLRPEGHAHGA
jgi:hypothetical protein